MMRDVPTWGKLAVLGALLVGAALAEDGGAQDDGEDEYDDLLGDSDYGLTALMKKVSGHKNHHVSHHDHFWHYLALLTIKAKVVFVAVLIALGAAVFFYYGPHKCACPAPSLHHYGHEYPDRKGRSLDANLITRILESVSSNDLAPNRNDTVKNSCRRRLLCELQQLARGQTALPYTIKLFRLDVRNSKDYNVTRDEIKRCDLLYPKCSW